MIHKDTYKKGIEFDGSKGIVFIGDKILVYRRDEKTTDSPLCLDLPGGRRGDGESPYETFSRETKEEFGISIKKDELFFSAFIKEGEVPDLYSFFIVAKPLNISVADVVFGDEGIEWILMTPEEFIARPDGMKRQQQKVRDYLGGKMNIFYGLGF